jgi:hypothetical protein
MCPAFLLLLAAVADGATGNVEASVRAASETINKNEILSVTPLLFRPSIP